MAKIGKNLSLTTDGLCYRVTPACNGVRRGCVFRKVTYFTKQFPLYIFFAHELVTRPSLQKAVNLLHLLPQGFQRRVYIAIEGYRYTGVS